MGEYSYTAPKKQWTLYSPWSASPKQPRIVTRSSTRESSSAYDSRARKGSPGASIFQPESKRGGSWTEHARIVGMIGTMQPRRCYHSCSCSLESNNKKVSKPPTENHSQLRPFQGTVAKKYVCRRHACSIVLQHCLLYALETQT